MTTPHITQTIARVFPDLATTDDIHEAQRMLAGHWIITKTDGTKFNAHHVQLVGKRRTRAFDVMGIAFTSKNERVIAFTEHIRSAEKKVVDIDPDVLAARIAERRRNR